MIKKHVSGDVSIVPKRVPWSFTEMVQSETDDAKVSDEDVMGEDPECRRDRNFGQALEP